MIKNYLLTAIRSLKKHFFYSAINVAGLGLGIAVVLLLAAWIQHETSYDSFHEGNGEIYRSTVEFSFGGQVRSTTVSPTALLPTTMSNAPEAVAGTRVYNPSSWNPFIVKKGDKLFQETRFFVADSTFFKVFSFRLLQGSEETALSEPYSVILTTSAKEKYFGAEDALGKTLNINGSQDYLITGIMEDVPSNSSLLFDFLASFHSIRAGREDPAWFPANYLTFIKVQPGTGTSGIEKKVNDIVQRDLASELTDVGDYVRFTFIPLAAIHLYEEGNIRYIYIFSVVALLVLIIACINYVNLATARAADRAREVGLRKVVGAAKGQLFTQFMGESAVITLTGFGIAYLMAIFALPFFNTLTGKVLTLEVLYSPEYLATVLILIVVVILLSGAYPALVMTSLQTISTLKGNFKSSTRGLWLRKSLVVVQFAVSLVLLVGTLVVLRQLSFMQTKALGFDRENILILPMDRKTDEVFEAVRTEVLRSGVVSYLGRATESPTEIDGGYTITMGGQSRELMVTATAADEQFVPALGMTILEGRNFTEADLDKVTNDTLYAFLVNESLLREFSIPVDKAIGTRARLNGRNGEIVGVLKDFHFATLHKPIGPLVIFDEPWQLNYMFARLVPGNPTSSLASLRQVLGSVTPHRPFEYEFIDEEYASLYIAETRMGGIVVVFAVLALTIAGLGLLGLVSFAAAQKTKEIGIRKVMGATSTGIVLLITRDFMRLVIVAIVLGVPASYLLMQQWLTKFAYQAQLTATPFALAALMCMVIAYLAAGYQAVRASRLDPARTLRTE